MPYFMLPAPCSIPGATASVVISASSRGSNTSKLIDLKWVRALTNAMSLREDADYADAFSPEGAKMSVGNANGFVRETARILDAGIGMK